MNQLKVPGRQRLTYLLLSVAASTLVTATIILYNNSFRSMPLYLFLLFTGIGVILTLAPLRGAIAGMIILCLWITLKRALGAWDDFLLLNNLIEIVSVLVVFGASGFYQHQLSLIYEAYYDNLQKLDQFDLLDERINLVKPAIGRLRLVEEEERSVRYRRPFSLVLIQIQSNSKQDLSPQETSFMMRAVANTLKSTTRKTDVPFLAASDQIGLILPETGLSGANKAVSNVMQQMTEANYYDPEDGKVRLENLIQLRYGCATFMGCSQSRINMLQAAQLSLQESMRVDPDKAFQNEMVDWKLIGEPAAEEVGVLTQRDSVVCNFRNDYDNLVEGAFVEPMGMK